MQKNPISTNYEPLETKLINKCKKLNIKIYNAIEKANAKNTSDLLLFLSVFASTNFGAIRKATNEYLGVIDKLVDNTSNKHNLGKNGAITKQIQNQTYIELNTNLVIAEQEMMNSFKRKIKQFKNRPTHIIEVKEALQEEFVKNGGATITYRNGAKVRLDKYFTMVTRTARTETQNLTSINDAKRLGTDYVYLLPNYHSTCKTCASLGGRVYCISGKDTSYPAVYDKLFKNGYNCIHPHCRCVLKPYFIEQHSNEELLKQKKASNRDWNLDDRTEEIRQSYQEMQGFNRKQWNSQLEFEEMQKAYGKEAPYETLGGLRRGKTVNSEYYRQVKNNIGELKKYSSLGSGSINNSKNNNDKLRQNENAENYYLKTIDISNIEIVKKEVEEQMNRIVEYDVEHCVVVDKNGNVYETVGNNVSVLPVNISMKGAINIHNHLEDVSFSEDDFYYFRDKIGTEFLNITPNYIHKLEVLKEIDKPYNYFYLRSLDYGNDEIGLNHRIMKLMQSEGYIKYEKNLRNTKMQKTT